MKAYRHDAHELFGIGKEKDEHFWNAVIRQTVVSGFLKKDIETYGVLKLTDEGIKYMKNPTSFMLIEERDYLVQDHDSMITSTKGAAFDQNQYDHLFHLRQSLSKKTHVPHPVIFQKLS